MRFLFSEPVPVSKVFEGDGGSEGSGHLFGQASSFPRVSVGKGGGGDSGLDGRTNRGVRSAIGHVGLQSPRPFRDLVGGAMSCQSR